MKVLLDTHVMLSLLRRDLPKRYPAIANLLADPATICFVSVASLWEVAIKTRLGKLDPGLPLEEIEGYLEALGLVIDFVGRRPPFSHFETGTLLEALGHQLRDQHHLVAFDGLKVVGYAGWMMTTTQIAEQAH